MIYLIYLIYPVCRNVELRCVISNAFCPRSPGMTVFFMLILIEKNRHICQVPDIDCRTRFLFDIPSHDQRHSELQSVSQHSRAYHRAGIAQASRRHRAGIAQASRRHRASIAQHRAASRSIAQHRAASRSIAQASRSIAQASRKHRTAQHRHGVAQGVLIRRVAPHPHLPYRAYDTHGAFLQ